MLLCVFTKGRERVIQYLLTGSQNQDYRARSWTARSARWRRIGGFIRNALRVGDPSQGLHLRCSGWLRYVGTR